MGQLLKKPSIRLLLFCALALAAFSGRGFAAGYDSLIEQGGFYLERGATYGADAVRALESARDAEPGRAAADPKFLSALARAYAMVSRFTEAFWTLDAWQKTNQWGAEGESLRSSLLTESGLAPVRLISAVPLEQVTLRLKPAEGTRLDVTARKALDRLAELLETGFRIGANGLTFLVPEGRYELSSDAPGLFAPRKPTSVEATAGEEAVLRLIPLWPSATAWKIAAGNRSVTLSWPEIAGSTYELTREIQSVRQLVYRGEKAEYQDTGLPVGARATYDLRILGAGGECLSASSVVADTQPPVSRVSVNAVLEQDLRTAVAWELGGGAADRVRVLRRRGSQEELLAEIRDPALLRKGSFKDAVFLPEVDAIPLTYRVEAWLGDGNAPAAVGTAQFEIPRRVAQVTEVVQSIERGAIVVQWETSPKDAIAQGYLVYVQRGEGIEGELVARVPDPFTREYLYDVEDPVKASGWRHFVVPYVGDQVFLDPSSLIFRGRVPEENFEKRAGAGKKLPNLALSWEPSAGAVAYEVAVSGWKEVLVKKTYVELEGLQNSLMAASHSITVTAIDATGKRVEILKQEIGYRHYPRPARREAK